MMNLHNIVRRAINSVNPDQPVIVRLCTGQNHKPGGIKEAVYSDIPAIAQIQPVPSNEIQFIDNYVSSSEYRNFYLNGDFSGLSRRSETGGDLIIWRGKTYFIDSEPEPWSATVGWTKVRGVRELNNGG